MQTYFSSTTSSLEDIDVHAAMRSLINKPVLLLNYYKEIPVSYSARVLDYDSKGHASVRCHPVQARLIDYDRYTILRHGRHAFKANLVGFGDQAGPPPEEQKMRFTRFLPVEVFTDQRNLVRVVFDDPIDVGISHRGTRYSAQMLDSSATSFRVKALPELPMESRDHCKVNFTLPLTAGPALIEADAMLVKKNSDEQIFSMDISKAQEETLMRYVNQRQVEIIRELNQM